MKARSFLFLDAMAVFFLGYVFLWVVFDRNLSTWSWVVLLLFSLSAAWRIYRIRSLMAHEFVAEKARQYKRVQWLASIPMYAVLLLVLLLLSVLFYVAYLVNQVDNQALQNLVYELLDRDSLLRRLFDIYGRTPTALLATLLAVAGASRLIGWAWFIRRLK